MVSQPQVGRRNREARWPFLKRSFKYPAGIHASLGDEPPFLSFLRLGRFWSGGDKAELHLNITDSGSMGSGFMSTSCRYGMMWRRGVRKSTGLLVDSCSVGCMVKKLSVNCHPGDFKHLLLRELRSQVTRKNVDY